MNAFFQDLPPSLEEAAMVDGASRIQTFYRVALPLDTPDIVTTAILCLVFSWNDFAFALPDSVSDNAGALMEPLSVGIWACKKAGVTAGDHVLNTGAGPIGLVAMQVAFAQGATEVTLTDVADERLRIGNRLGATRTLNLAEKPLEESGIEVDALIECSGNERALGHGIHRVRPAGVTVVVGIGQNEETRVPLSFIQTHEIMLTGTFRYASTYPTAIDLAASGKLDLDAMVTSSYGLPETKEALQTSGKDPANVKPMVIPDGT